VVEDSPKRKNKDNDEQNNDDIDQAFAAYGSDFSRLHDKFEMVNDDGSYDGYNDENGYMVVIMIMMMMVKMVT